MHLAGTPQTPISLDFETLTPYIRDLHKKQEVTVQSLRKVEEGRLVLCVRLVLSDSSFFQPHMRS